MKTPVGPVFFAALVGCVASVGCADPPLLEAPGAQVVGVARTSDAIALWQALGRAHLVDTPALNAATPMLVADAPFVASKLASGVVVVATRINVANAATSPLATSPKPVLGATNAVDVGGERVLVRVDKNRALLALRTTPDDEATVAALLEVMAGIKPSDAPAIALPKPGTVAVRVAAGALPVDVGALEAVVTPGAATIDVDARADNPSADVRAALESVNPPFLCTVEKDADVVVALPPFKSVSSSPVSEANVQNPDAFDGRLAFAAYKDGSVLIAGVPRADPTALLGELPKAAGVAVHTDGARKTYALGHVHAVVDDHVFAFARGDATPIEAVGREKCASPPSSLLLRLRTGTLAPALAQALPGNVGAAVAFVASTFDAIDVDASAAPEKDAHGVSIKAHVALRARPVQE